MDQDLAFARVVLDVPSRGTAPAVATLREMVPLADLLFESGPGAFSVILPDADLDHALRHMEALRSRLAELGHPASIGVSARGPRLIEAGTLLEEAETAARKAAREGGDRVVGFRADPAKFRVAVAAVT
jgi:GGDEF domain-containing protein